MPACSESPSAYISQETRTRRPLFVTTVERGSFRAIPVDGVNDGRWPDLSRSFSVKAQKSPRRGPVRCLQGGLGMSALQGQLLEEHEHGRAGRVEHHA